MNLDWYSTELYAEFQALEKAVFDLERNVSANTNDQIRHKLYMARCEVTQAKYLAAERHGLELSTKRPSVCTCPATVWTGSEPNDSTCELSDEEHEQLKLSPQSGKETR